MTYVERLSEYNPSGLGLYFKVFEVIGVVRCAEGIDDGSIVVSIFIRCGYTQNIGADAGILLHVFNIFLKENVSFENTIVLNLVFRL